MPQMNLGLPSDNSTSPIGVSVSRENVHPEDTRLFEASYSYGAQAITEVRKLFPFLPPVDLTRIQKIIQDRYRQWIVEERCFCLNCGSPRIIAIENNNDEGWECRDCKAIGHDVDFVQLASDEIEVAA